GFRAERPSVSVCYVVNDGSVSCVDGSEAQDFALTTRIPVNYEGGSMKRIVAVTAAVAALAGTAAFAPVASAGNVGWSVSVGAPGFAVSAGSPGYWGYRGYGYGYRGYGYGWHRPWHRPVVVAPPVVYPAPVYVAPRPVVVAPPVYAPAPNYG